MDIISGSNINGINYEFPLTVKSTDDIFNELNLKNEEELLICKSIINNLEKQLSNNIRNNKCVSIPSIGCVRINPVKRAIQNSSNLFRTVRKQTTKTEYRKYVSEFIIDLQDKQKDIDKKRIIINKIRSNNKNRYEELYKLLGRAYAEMFIYSIYILKEVPYDDEFEEVYNALK